MSNKLEANVNHNPAISISLDTSEGVGEGGGCREPTIVDDKYCSKCDKDSKDFRMMTAFNKIYMESYENESPDKIVV